MIYPACPKCGASHNVWVKETIEDKADGFKAKLWCKSCSVGFDGEVLYSASTEKGV